MMKNILLYFPLFILAACANPRPVSPSSLSNIGEEKLNALFAERLNYIQNQGGPYINDEDIQRQTKLLFWFVDDTYCPHCPRTPRATEDQEIRNAKDVQAKAEGGDPLSQYFLAVRYLEGKGILQNSKQGVFWMEKAALNGSGDAAYDLGQMYDRGLHVPVSKRNAVKFYEISIKNNALNRTAKYRLGEMYEYGIGVSEDFSQAMDWYKKSDESNGLILPNGYQRAEFSIGRLYAQGKGLPKNYAEASEWFLKASDYGKGYGGMVGEAQCALAIMYSTGLGVKLDNEQAEFWLRRPNTLSYCHSLMLDHT
ncbi:tetratricopeptide repeat protein [Collimonas arenae]|nr:tetratricopeptide repeat protein [Collimonas arenae]